MSESRPVTGEYVGRVGWTVEATPWVCLASLAVAFAGLFLPFASVNCTLCPLALYPEVFSNTLMANAVGWVLVAILLAAAGCTVLCLTGVRKVLTVGVAALLSLAVVGLVLFELTTASVGILHWNSALPTAPEWGFYLSLVGAAGAALSGGWIVQQP